MEETDAVVLTARELVVVTSLFWAVVSIFIKMWYDRKMKFLEHSLKFDTDRRLKTYEIKAKQYSDYITMLDTINQEDFELGFESIKSTWGRYLNQISTSETDEKIQLALDEFMSNLNTTMQEITKRVSITRLKINAASNSLKLLATNEMLVTIDRIEKNNTELGNLGLNVLREQMRILQASVEECPTNIPDLALKTPQLEKATEDSKNLAKLLLNQMRSEINIAQKEAPN